MKHLFLSMAMLATICSSAQNQSGTVNYQRIISLGDIKLDNLPPEMAAMMPKESKDEKILYFTTDAALYENNKTLKKEEPTNMDMGGMQIHINREMPDEKSYVDLKNKKSIEQKSLMGRDFLIKEDLKSYKWKITGNQKKILDYPAMEAMAITEKDTLLAWYTTEIPVSAGPDGIGGLPGLILEVGIGKKVVIKATAVKLDDAVAANIKEPTKGKKITEEEYNKLVKEKQEEMKQQFGGSGARIIIRE